MEVIVEGFKKAPNESRIARLLQTPLWKRFEKTFQIELPLRTIIHTTRKRKSRTSHWYIKPLLWELRILPTLNWHPRDRVITDALAAKHCKNIANPKIDVRDIAKPGTLPYHRMQGVDKKRKAKQDW